MNSRPWILAASAIGIAVALVWWLRPDGVSVVLEDAAQTGAATPEPVAAAAPESAQVAARPAQATNVEPARAPLPGETATPMAALLEGAREDFPAAITENELRFAAEPIDAAWAPGAEAEILGKFAQHAGLRLLDLRLHCRSTMCRLQVTLPKGAVGTGSPGELLETVGLEATFLNSLWDPSGALNTVAYLSRDPASDRRCCFPSPRNE